MNLKICPGGCRPSHSSPNALFILITSNTEPEIIQESLHDAVHGLIGNGGHFTYVSAHRLSSLSSPMINDFDVPSAY